jgi:formimidoylglutamase
MTEPLIEDPRIPSNLREQMRGPWYLGPSTFMKTVALSEPSELDEWQPDVAIIGAPWDDVTVDRTGARLGPRAVRLANYVYPFWHLDLEVAPMDELRVIDYGDAVCAPGLVARSHDAIRTRVREVAERKITPVVIGGDHSITFPSAAAVAETLEPGSLGMVHFDAHADTAPDFFGNLASHGSPMRRLIESGAIPGKNFVQVGLRGYWPPPDILRWMHEQGMRWHLMSEIHDNGISSVIEDAIQEALDGPDYVYISLDIDVLDPAYAPGTSAPEPAGMTSADLLKAVRQIVLRTNVVALDVVEVSPPYDLLGTTAQSANRSILEFLSAMAVTRRNSPAASESK